MASPSKDLGIISSVDNSMSNNIITVNQIGDRESVDNIAGNFTSSISLSGELNSGAIFELFFGQATDTATTGDYKHVFVNRGTTDILNNIDSFTLMENQDSTSDITQKFSGVKVNTVDIAVDVGDTVKVDSECFAASVTTGTSVGTKVSTSTKALSFQNCTLSVGDEGSESSVGQVQSFSLSLNNNISEDDVRALGSREAQEFIPILLETTGEFTIKVQDKTLLERFLGGSSPTSTSPTDSGLIFNANNGVALGSGRIDFYVKLLGVQFEEVSEAITFDGVTEQTFSFTVGNIDDIWTTDAVASYF